MRKIRNPRYCPESLEKRLSPSGVAAAPPAEVGGVAAGVDDPFPPYDPTQPCPPPPPPPPIPPGGPGGPDQG